MRTTIRTILLSFFASLPCSEYSFAQSSNPILFDSLVGVENPVLDNSFTAISINRYGNLTWDYLDSTNVSAFYIFELICKEKRLVSIYYPKEPSRTHTIQLKQISQAPTIIVVSKPFDGTIGSSIMLEETVIGAAFNNNPSYILRRRKMRKRYYYRAFDRPTRFEIKDDFDNIVRAGIADKMPIWDLSLGHYKANFGNLCGIEIVRE